MKERIFLEAQRLSRKWDTRDPFELLDMLNVVVERTRAFPRDGLKGFCTVINRTRYVVVNDRLPVEQQRVVAVHEAGHIVLHGADLRIGAAFRDNDVYTATGKKEREANFFSADFLIPDEDVIENMRACDANFFNVARAVHPRAVFCI